MKLQMLVEAEYSTTKVVGFNNWMSACRKESPTSQLSGTEASQAQMVDWESDDNRVVGNWDGKSNEGLVFRKPTSTQPATESVNHMGEREYQTYSGWKAACKKAYPGCTFRGDKDIGAAVLNDKDVGEWDGAVGSVYKKELSEKWYILTPAGKPVGKGFDSSDEALAKWNTISPALRKDLKIRELADDHEAVRGAEPTEPGPVEPRVSESEEGPFFIVTPDGEKVGKGHLTYDAALAKWRTISEPLRKGLKIIEEAACEAADCSKEYTQGYNYRKNYKYLYGRDKVADAKANPYDKGSVEYAEWDKGFNASGDNLHETEQVNEDDTISDVINARDAMKTGLHAYQQFLTKLRDHKGEEYSTEVHRLAKQTNVVSEAVKSSINKLEDYINRNFYVYNDKQSSYPAGDSLHYVIEESKAKYDIRIVETATGKIRVEVNADVGTGATTARAKEIKALLLGRAHK